MPRAKIGARRHVILSKPQNLLLEAVAKKTGITPSEHIRRAIDMYFRAMAAENRR